MKKIFSIILVMTLIGFSSFNEKQSETKIADGKELIGRWNLTVNVDGKSLPSWLEVKLSGTKMLVGSFVSIVGSARPVSQIHFEAGKFWFNIPPQWEAGDKDFVIEGKLENDQLEGTITTSDGKTYSFTGIHAPELKRTSPPVWGKPIKLFNGKDLTGWTAMGKNQWVVENGILTSSHAGANLISVQKFNDFKLHVEFRYPKGSNSGVYLRGRYEVQIEDSPKEAHPSSVLFGGIYVFYIPTKWRPKAPMHGKHLILLWLEEK
jgi:hypothetical protein